MELFAPITQLASAFREFVAPRYRPELYARPGAGLRTPREQARRNGYEARRLLKISVTWRRACSGTNWSTAIPPAVTIRPAAIPAP